MCGEAGIRCPSARWHTGSYATCRVPHRQRSSWRPRWTWRSSALRSRRTRPPAGKGAAGGPGGRPVTGCAGNSSAGPTTPHAPFGTHGIKGRAISVVAPPWAALAAVARLLGGAGHRQRKE